MRTLAQLEADLIAITKAQEQSKTILQLYCESGTPRFHSVLPVYAVALTKVLQPLLPVLNALVREELNQLRASTLA